MNILIVGPHPDDQELAMGGTAIRLAEQGHNVLLLDMTNGEPTPYGSPAIREREWTEAGRIMGVQRHQLGLPNRRVEHNLNSRYQVAGVIRKHQAQILFVPYFEDAHPDHLATTRIVEDARFDAKLTKIDLPGEPIYPKWLFYYYATHLRVIPNPSFLVDITPQMDRKEAAIRAYHSQFVIPEKNRHVLTWVRQMNGYMGSRIGTEYAEPFFSREPLGLGSLDSLL